MYFKKGDEEEGNTVLRNARYIRKKENTVMRKYP